MKIIYIQPAKQTYPCFLQSDGSDLQAIAFTELSATVLRSARCDYPVGREIHVSRWEELHLKPYQVIIELP